MIYRTLQIQCELGNYFIVVLDSESKIYRVTWLVNGIKQNVMTPEELSTELSPRLQAELYKHLYA